MTEKQYSLVYYADKGGAFIKNNETGTEWYHDSRASLLEIVNELNELAEENKQLKQEMSDLGTTHAEEINKIEDEFDEEILKLEKENEQLKSILKEMVRVSEYNGAISPMRVKSMVYNFMEDFE